MMEKLKKKISDFDWRTFFRYAMPSLCLGTGVIIGGAIKDAHYNKILSGCDINAWDKFEKDVKVGEFFGMLSPEMRVSPKCKTQIFIN